MCACECACAWRRRPRLWCRRRWEPVGLGSQGSGALSLRSRPATESRGAGTGEVPAGRALGARPCRTPSWGPVGTEGGTNCKCVSNLREGLSWPGAGVGVGGQERCWEGARCLYDDFPYGPPAALVLGREQVGSCRDRRGLTRLRGPFVIFLSVGSLLPSSSAFWIGRRPVDRDSVSL